MLDQLNLSVTKRSPRTMDLIRLRDELTGSPAGSELSAEQSQRLNRIMEDLRMILTAETSGKFAFVVTEKRLDTQKLLSDVKALMPDGIFDVLPTIAKYDFEQSGRAIAFELSTAAAFHSLRATEAVLRDFYCKIVKHKRVRQLMWGDMLTHLERRRVPPPDEITQLLKHIKDSFRNPTQHSDKMKYEIDEVQNLFSLCIDAVSRMTIYLKENGLN